MDSGPAASWGLPELSWGGSGVSWVVLGGSWGLLGPPGAYWGPPGGLLGASLGLPGRLLGRPGASWTFPGSLLGPPGGVLGPSLGSPLTSSWESPGQPGVCSHFKPLDPGRQARRDEQDKQLQRSSWEPPGPNKNSLVSSGGPPEKSPSEISPSQGVPGAALGSILGAPGDHFGPSFGGRC